jgi:hypothetical protein
MKTTVALLHRVLFFDVLLVACLASSCSLLPEPSYPAPPYFPFTNGDKQWQKFATGTQWVFENQRRERRTYQVSKVTYEEKIPETLAHPYIKVLSYHDYWIMSWERVDSAARAGYFILRRVPAEKNPSQSVLAAEAYWDDYIGQHNDTGGVYTRYLNFGADLSTIKFHTLAVRGVNYQYVTSFQASALAIIRLQTIYRFATQRTTQVEYDQEAGVVRFVTLNGDIWERLP